MTNIRIRKTMNGTWVVIADSDRFGMDGIVFESYKKDDCISYVKGKGYGYYMASIDDDDSIRGKGCSMKDMKIRKLKNGWSVTDGDVKDTVNSFFEATMWVWNMAPNHDVSNAFCRKACDKWGVNVYGWRAVMI